MAWDSGYEDEVEEFAPRPSARPAHSSSSPAAFNLLSNLLRPLPLPDAPVHATYVADMALDASERKKIKDCHRSKAHRKDGRFQLQVNAGTTLKQVAIAKAQVTKSSATLVTFQLLSQSKGWTGPRVAPHPTILSLPDALQISGLTLITSDPRYVSHPSPSFTPSSTP